MQFVAEDIYHDWNNGSGGSLVEAAVDDVVFEAISSSSDCDAIGDINEDEIVNILDVVQIVNIILNNPSPPIETYCAADINGDNAINVLDVVVLVNIILN